MTFLKYLAAIVIIGIIQFLNLFLITIINKDKPRRSSFSSVFRCMANHINMVITILSYSSPIYMIIFALGFYKVFACLAAIEIVVLLVIATLGAYGVAIEDRAINRYKTGYCWAVMFVLNWINYFIINVPIEALLQTCFDYEFPTFIIDITAFGIFAFDIYLLVRLIKESKIECSNENVFYETFQEEQPVFNNTQHIDIDAELKKIDVDYDYCCEFAKENNVSIEAAELLIRTKIFTENYENEHKIN